MNLEINKLRAQIDGVKFNLASLGNWVEYANEMILGMEEKIIDIEENEYDVKYSKKFIA
jgi:hypothetical protein